MSADILPFPIRATQADAPLYWPCGGEVHRGDAVLNFAMTDDDVKARIAFLRRVREQARCEGDWPVHIALTDALRSLHVAWTHALLWRVSRGNCPTLRVAAASSA